MRTVTPTAARDTVAPTLHKAQETLNGTVLPAVRDVLTTARDRGADLLDSDVALEARRRGLAVMHAAKGQPVLAPARRWKFGLGMIAIGGTLGFAISWLAKRLSAPVDSYTQTMPVPSGTDGGTFPASGVTTVANTADAGGTTTEGANGTAPAGTAIEDIDLRSGSPSRF